MKKDTGVKPRKRNTLSYTNQDTKAKQQQQKKDIKEDETQI